MDEDVLVASRVVEVVRRGDLARGVTAALPLGRGDTCRGSSRRLDVAGAGERGGVSGVLLVPSLEQHHAHVERKRRNEEQRDEAAREQDEDLAALVASDQLLMTRLDSAEIVIGGRGRGRIVW